MFWMILAPQSGFELEGQRYTEAEARRNRWTS